MNMTMRVAVAAAMALLCVAAAAAGAPDGRVGRKQQRPTRGFKNMEMMTARGFGKRARTEHVQCCRKFTLHDSSLLTARDFGKRGDGKVGMDNFWENLENAQDKDVQDSGEKALDSIPLDWFVNELVNNPDFARSVVRKFVDLNQDGMLSSDELLRNL